jgi:CubicO group peptidase (beta-lactamase class C family)
MGFVVAVVEKGRPVRYYAEGVSGVVGVPLDSSTVFEIGSVTKVFTGALLADMVARGEVRLDDPVAKFLPKTVRVPSRGSRQITLLDLATQSSGLPRLPTNMRPADGLNPYADYTVAQLYQFLSAYTLTRDIGAQYEYSNLGVGLLGHALSMRAGKPYGELVKERILVPLGMHDTSIELSPSMKSRMAQGFNAEAMPMHLWDLPTLAGAGALRSTASDMAKFLVANMDSADSPVRKALVEARTPRRDADRPGNHVGLGWHIVDVFGTKLTWHNGGTGGYRAFVGMDEQKKRGVVLLSNSTITPDDIAFHLLESRVPLVGAPAAPKARVEIPVDSAKLENYVGVYQLAPNFQLTITREGSSLFAQGTGQPKVQLFAESETDFFLKVTDAQVTFTRDSSGKVNQLVLHQNGANIAGLRVTK